MTMIPARAFWQDRKAAIALMFVALTIPLICVLALAIDFGSLALQRVQLNNAADSAALAAVNAAANGYAANPSSNYIAFGNQAGAQMFTAQAAKLAFSSVPTPRVAVSASGGTFTATVSYSASMPTSFGRAFGMSTMYYAGNSGATVTPQRYVAIQMMLDTSASMGLMTDLVNGPAQLNTAMNSFLGTTATNTNLFDATATYNGNISISNYRITDNNVTCQFACHNDSSTSGPLGKSNDFYGVAEAYGVQLRIDVLRTAVLNVIGQMQSASNSQYLAVGLYSYSSGFNTLYATSSNLSGGYTAANNVTLTPTPPYCTAGTSTPRCANSTWATGSYGWSGWNPAWGFRDGAVPATSFETAMNSFISTTLTPTPAMDGTTAARAARYMFLVTDGVDDYTSYTARDSGCCNQFVYAMNTTNGVNGTAVAAGSTVCDQIKATGVTIMVLYTTYQPNTSATFTTMVAPLLSPSPTNNAVVTALTACASSPSYFYQAATDADIGTQLNNMLSIATASAGRFTN